MGCRRWYFGAEFVFDSIFKAVFRKGPSSQSLKICSKFEFFFDKNWIPPKKTKTKRIINHINLVMKVWVLSESVTETAVNTLTWKEKKSASKHHYTLCVAVVLFVHTVSHPWGHVFYIPLNGTPIVVGPLSNRLVTGCVATFIDSFIFSFYFQPQSNEDPRKGSLKKHAVERSCPW